MPDEVLVLYFSAFDLHDFGFNSSGSICHVNGTSKQFCAILGLDLDYEEILSARSLITFVFWSVYQPLCSHLQHQCAGV